MDNKIVEIEDFLQDEEFLLWVRRPSVESNKYWKAWMEANPESVAVMLMARELLLSMNNTKKIPLVGEREEVLNNIIKKLDAHNIYRTTYSNNNWKAGVISVAASLLLLLSVAFYFFSQQQPPHPKKEVVAESITIKETPPGIKLQTVLPDGSRVWLNAESKVSYDQFYGQKQRKVYLEGEAFFEVEKDEARPFIVQSGELRITALGTSFNVKSLAGTESSEVALVTGKVAVEKEGDDEQKVVLNPGQKAVHKSQFGQLLMSEFSLDNEIAWKNGIIVFDNATFEEIQKTLERWYGVKIYAEMSKKDQWNYTGKFDNQSLELVLKRLAFIKGFQFRIEENKVYLFNPKTE